MFTVFINLSVHMTCQPNDLSPIIATVTTYWKSIVVNTIVKLNVGQLTPNMEKIWIMWECRYSLTLNSHIIKFSSWVFATELQILWKSASAIIFVHVYFVLLLTVFLLDYTKNCSTRTNYYTPVQLGVNAALFHFFWFQMLSKPGYSCDFACDIYGYLSLLHLYYLYWPWIVPFYTYIYMWINIFVYMFVTVHLCFRCV